MYVYRQGMQRAKLGEEVIWFQTTSLHFLCFSRSTTITNRKVWSIHLQGTKILRGWCYKSFGLINIFPVIFRFHNKKKKIIIALAFVYIFWEDNMPSLLTQCMDQPDNLWRLWCCFQSLKTEKCFCTLWFNW